MIQDLGRFIYHPQLRHRFRSGELVNRWFADYPHLFEERDKVLADHQAKRGYHFYEWLAVNLLYQSTGFYSLLEKYAFKRHQRKQAIFRNLVSPEFFEFVMDKKSDVQPPNLLVYAPDFSQCFFCEVNGPKDRLSKSQINYFESLSEMSGKTIYMLHFKEVTPEIE